MFGSHLACHVCSRSNMMQRIELVWPLTFMSVCYCFSRANRKHSLTCLTAFGASAWGITNQINVNGVLFPPCTCLEPWNLGAVFCVNVPCSCTRPPPSLSSSFLVCCFLFSQFLDLYLKGCWHTTQDLNPQPLEQARVLAPYTTGRWRLLPNFSFSSPLRWHLKKDPALCWLCESVIVCVLWGSVQGVFLGCKYYDGIQHRRLWH